ncbi:MAG: lytic transglycosylase domain-containing protein [Sphingomonas sp.]|uniref:lytic transglycosylase domain-containing protein n=1 Tax=Sphingomonas sp. TaxID=28214 RepID=UPI002274F673|nr:lytic transglycosylase domain-containing protein [Sphingomonas sp.]MCX8477997.1 lytic transglycosylase domain-containing protein [Sphingomonas sp.]
MARLRPGLAGLAILVAAPAAADPVADWQPLIEAASARCGVPAVWIAEVMRAESSGRTEWNGRPIVSRAGAMGLMQLMPGTWAEMRAALRLGPDPHRPRDNILAGACYLRRLYDRFGHPGLFAAYNAGPARYAAHLATGKALPAETRAYLTSLAGSLSGYAVRAGEPLERPGLFFVRHEASSVPQQQSDGSLFLLLSDEASDARPDR